MTSKNEPRPVSGHPAALLRVSLVSGLDPVERSAVCRRLAEASRRPSTMEASDDSADDGEFAEFLAGRILESAQGGTRGHTLVELDETADVVEVGFVMETVFESRRHEGPPAELHDLVTVATIRDIDLWLLSAAPSPADDFDTAERLASQLEFATVIVLSDADDAAPESLRSALGLLHHLNPNGAIVAPSDLTAVGRNAPSGRGCARRLGQRMGWMLALADPKAPSARHHDPDVVVFRDPRPFHPERLAEAIRDALTPSRVGRIARSRGLIQLATRADRIGSWTSAGDTLSLDPTSMSSWDEHAPSGQELVFFGEALDRERIVTALSDSLLTDRELLAGPMHWGRYDDPFPAWPVPHDH